MDKKAKTPKKPKQNKTKVVVSSSPFAAASHTNPAKAVIAGKRR